MVGALSIEAAAKHLNARDIDGIVLGEGFSPRVVDAFLTVLTEDARFRNLPVVVTAVDLAPAYDLPNLEIVSGDPAQVVATALPLIRQHAFEAHLSRTLKAIDADGLIDARTGLLTPEAFERDFASAIYQTQQRGGGLSVARFAFDPEHPRAQFDGARIISRLMRQMDFGAAQEDGSVVVVFAETDLKTAHTHRAAAVERDAPYQPRQTRRTIGAGCHASQRCCRTIPRSRCGRGFRKKRIAPRRNCSADIRRNNSSCPALSIINSALEDDMKKIALITASLAMLASPASPRTPRPSARRRRKRNSRRCRRTRCSLRN